MKRTIKILSLILCLVLAASPFTVIFRAAAESEAPSFIFNNARTAAYLVSPNNTTAVFSPSEGAVILTTTAASCDPYIYVNVEAAGDFSADEYGFLVVTYKARTAASSAFSEFFLCAGDIALPSADHSVMRDLSVGTGYVSDVINLSSDSGWHGKIHQIRYDYFGDCAAGDSIVLSSLIFAKSAEEASAVAAERSAAANRQTEERVITYDFKSASDAERITCPGASYLPGDVNSDGRVSIADSLLLRRHIAGLSSVSNAEAADINRDGRVSSADVTLLRRHLSGIVNVEFFASDAKISYSSEKSAAEILARRTSPEVCVNFGEGVDTDVYSYVVFTYILDASADRELKLTFENGASESFAASADGLRHSVRLLLAENLQWSGNPMSLNVAAELEKGERLYIDSLIFTESYKRAGLEASKREESDGADGYEKLVFDSEDSLSVLNAANSSSVVYNAAEDAARLTVEGKNGDPQVAIDYSGGNVSADDNKYIIITYKVPSSTSASASSSELFLCAGDIVGATAGYSKTFEPIKDGSYHYAVISMTEDEYWSGKINLIRFDFFSSCATGDSMLLDSVCLAPTRAAAVEIGKTRQALKNGGEYPGSMFEGSITVNGERTAVKYFDASAVSDGNATFSGQMSAVISDNESDFNRFTLGYTSNAIVRGIAYYTVDGKEQADEFFLENTSGKTGSFTSLITKYFGGKTAERFTMIELYTINTQSASVKLVSLDKEQYVQYEQGTYFLGNDNYKLGVDLLMGGGVNYLEYYNDNNPAYGNLLNNYDVGRLIQQSYYGIDRPPYPMGYWTDREWGYNPVQGGDKVNNISRIIDFEIRDENTVYVKARPMDWGQVNMATPSYMENIYTLTDDYVHVYNRFVDFSGYTHTEGWQELPAFYTISALNKFSYYNGSAPWTGDSLITRDDLVFWGQVSNQAFELKRTSEFWSAWTDNSGFGVGLYVPGVYTYHAGRFMYDGSCDPSAASTNYVAPRRYLTLICGKPLEYSYLVKAGSLSEIRESFKENRNLINNSALENYNK